jgi:hypothetical protein
VSCRRSSSGSRSSISLASCVVIMVLHIERVWQLGLSHESLLVCVQVSQCWPCLATWSGVAACAPAMQQLTGRLQSAAQALAMQLGQVLAAAWPGTTKLSKLVVGEAVLVLVVLVSRLLCGLGHLCSTHSLPALCTSACSLVQTIMLIVRRVLSGIRCIPILDAVSAAAVTV